MIRRLLAAALAAGLCACGAGAPAEIPPPGAEEYAIYSDVLRAEVLPENEGFPLLVDSTWAMPPEREARSERISRSYVGDSVRVPRSLSRRFDLVNRRSYALTPSFSPGGEYRMLGLSTYDAFFGRGGDGWDGVKAHHPGTLGIVQFSRAAIDARRGLALVYYEHGCGLLCGSGNLVLLRRDAGRWRVVDSSMIWVS